MMLFWTYLNYKLIGEDKSDIWNYLLPSVGVITISLGLLSYMSFVFSRQNTLDTKYGFLVMFIGPITHICLNHFKYGSEKKGFYGIIMMMNYYIVFMSQGVIFGIWQEKIIKRMREISETVVWPFFIIFNVMMYGVNFPGTSKDVGFIFFYPLYDDTLI